MNRNDKWQNNQDYKRAGDINLSEEQRKAIGDLAIAHLAGGNSDMFKLAMSSLAKIDTQQAITDQLATIATKLGQLDK